MLIDKALSVLGLRPVAARGTSPPSGRAGLWQALHHRGKRKWPSPGGGRGTHSLSYEAQVGRIGGVRESACRAGKPRGKFHPEVALNLLHVRERTGSRLFQDRAAEQLWYPIAEGLLTDCQAHSNGIAPLDVSFTHVDADDVPHPARSRGLS